MSFLLSFTSSLAFDHLPSTFRCECQHQHHYNIQCLVDLRPPSAPIHRAPAPILQQNPRLILPPLLPLRLNLHTHLPRLPCWLPSLLTRLPPNPPPRPSRLPSSDDQYVRTLPPPANSTPSSPCVCHPSASSPGIGSSLPDRDFSTGICNWSRVVLISGVERARLQSDFE